MLGGRGELRYRWAQQQLSTPESDADEYTASTSLLASAEHENGNDFVMTFPSTPTRFYRFDTSVNLAPRGRMSASAGSKAPPL